MNDDGSIPASLPSGGDLVGAFARLQGLLVSVSDVELFLEQLAQLAVQVTDGDTACGITMRYDGRPLTVASSDGRAALLDESQYEYADGPCLTALRTGTVVDVSDTGVETRWQERYLTTAIDQGVRCSLSLPLSWGETVMAALNVYGFDRPGMFGGDDRRVLELFAAQASGALWLAHRRTSDLQTRRDMETALASRTVIDQALGILMAQQQCTAERAFELLRMASQRENRKLRDVATELVTRVTGQPPQPSRAFE